MLFATLGEGSESGFSIPFLRRIVAEPAGRVKLPNNERCLLANLVLYIIYIMRTLMLKTKPSSL